MTRPDLETRAPGLTIERRGLLWLPALALGASAGASASPRSDRRDADEGGLDFAGLASELEGLASDHVEGGRVDVDVYLHRLQALGARLDPGSLPEVETRDFGGYDPPVETGLAHRALPVLVVEWRLAPGAMLPPHNHTPGSVVSVCLEGECWVRHFEVVGEAPPPGEPGEFRMRKTLAKLLRSGLSSTLSSSRDSIHTFLAGPEGARGIDLNTFEPGEGDWSMLTYEEGSREGFVKTYDATWIGKPGSG